jgi:phenylalanine-4-hydroxylase
MHEAVENLPDKSMFISQEYGAYSTEEHEVWSILYDRRMKDLKSHGSDEYLNGAEAIGLSRDSIPNLADVNRRLSRLTGWEAVAVSGFLPARTFFECLSERRFPTTVTIRPKNQLDYLPEPDIFHDVFGHVPLHSNPVFADLLQRCGGIGAAAQTQDQLDGITRLFWFTIEFGLIREKDEVKVYGSGLISSHGDSANALGGRCEKRPFSLDAVFAQPFEIDHFQEVLFVIDSFDQLFAAVDEAEKRIIGHS